ncbi:MAG TPA: class I SAM-dependent methyltransferase [Bacteroidales bacterium]|nr:class I SAM-dependent methyltransferase [Bacteroidales bacterium]
MSQEKYMVCPVGVAFSFDNRLRKIFQDPVNILRPYIQPGMKILDLGCGPGFFTLAIAYLLHNSGEVIAADLQQGMLDIIYNKITATRLASRIRLHPCKKDTIGLAEQVDFTLAFWMVHEVPDQDRLFSELYSLLKPGGLLFIIEPIIHVKKKDFEKMLGKAISVGFEVKNTPRVFFSRSVLMAKS